MKYVLFAICMILYAMPALHAEPVLDVPVFVGVSDAYDMNSGDVVAGIDSRKVTDNFTYERWMLSGDEYNESGIEDSGIADYDRSGSFSHDQQLTGKDITCLPQAGLGALRGGSSGFSARRSHS